MKLHLCDCQWVKLPHIIRVYLELHYMSKMPPPKSKSKSKRTKPYSKFKAFDIVHASLVAWEDSKDGHLIDSVFLAGAMGRCKTILCFSRRAPWGAVRPTCLGWFFPMEMGFPSELS